jgi:pilus assembly protein CpaF
MLVSIRIWQAGAEISRRDVDAPALLIVGRHSDCDVRLDSDQVSRTHARLTLGPAQFVLQDTSQNGTELGTGEILHHGPRELAYGSIFRVGAFTVRVGDPPADPDIEPPRAVPQAATSSARHLFGPTLVSGEEQPASVAPPSAAPDMQALRLRLHGDLLAQLERDGVVINAASAPKDIALRSRAIATLKRMARDLGLEPSPSRDAIFAEIAAEAIGFGPLEPLLAAADVTEIQVLDPATIFVEREGRRERTTAAFTDDARARAVVDRLLAGAGLGALAERTLVDVRLEGGTRLVAMKKPLAPRGTCLHLRKAPARRIGRDDAVGGGMMTRAELEWLELTVAARRSVVVCGEAGAGKTTLLGLLASAVPATESIAIVEEASELALWQPRVLALTTRASVVTAREALRAAAAFRPDRLVLGDCRGPEAMDLVGVAGAAMRAPMLASIEAASPDDALARLEELARPAAEPARIREAILRNVHVVVHAVRRDGGARRVDAILEVAELGSDGRIALRKVF